MDVLGIAGTVACLYLMGLPLWLLLVVLFTPGK